MATEAWVPARLIPVSGLGGSEERERRATSALLAVLSAVKEFSAAMLKPLGAPSGAASTYCEVPFQLSSGGHVRVDGAIQVTRGSKTWTLLVEVKTGTNELSQGQVESYLDVVKEQGFDGLLTISNQIVPIVGQHPVRVDGRKYGRVHLFHISWTRVLTLAHMVQEHQGVSDPDQAWILAELIRYLEYEGSGALAFDDMGPHWVRVRTAAGDQTLRLGDEGLDDVAARWDQFIQFLCLGLGARLGREVRPVLSRKELGEPGLRVAAVARDLAESGVLSGNIRIPDTVGPIQLSANVRRMVGSASVEVSAPELKRPSARVNWLLRQLRNGPSDLRIEVAFHHTRSTSAELLGSITDNPRVILTDSSRVPRSFLLALSHDVGAKRRAGKGAFIGDMSALLDSFYRDVVQDLKAWTPPAPHLAPPAQEERTLDKAETEPLVPTKVVSPPSDGTSEHVPPPE